VSNAVLARARELDIPSLAVIATEPDGTVIYWSTGATTLYGWTEAEALGRSIVELTPSEEAASQAAEIMGQLRRGQSWQGEFRVRDRDGGSFVADVTDIPVRDIDGELRGIIGVSRRITDDRPA
jgi:PAS domain S-box-containing protein